MLTLPLDPQPRGNVYQQVQQHVGSLAAAPRDKGIPNSNQALAAATAIPGIDRWTGFYCNCIVSDLYRRCRKVVEHSRKIWSSFLIYDGCMSAATQMGLCSNKDISEPRGSEYL